MNDAAPLSTFINGDKALHQRW